MAAGNSEFPTDFKRIELDGFLTFQSTALQSTSEASRVLRHELFVGLQGMFLSDGSYLSGGLPHLF